MTQVKVWCYVLVIYAFDFAPWGIFILNYFIAPFPRLAKLCVLTPWRKMQWNFEVLLVLFFLPFLYLEFVECMCLFCLCLIYKLGACVLGWAMFMFNVCSLAVTNSWMYAMLNCVLKLVCNLHLVSYARVDWEWVEVFNFVTYNKWNCIWMKVLVQFNHCFVSYNLLLAFF